MRKHIANIAVRIVARIGVRNGQPGTSVIARTVNRIAGGVIASCGGRLESRVIFFVLSPEEPEQVLRQVITKIVTSLGAERIVGRVGEATMSREEALSRSDIADMVPTAASTVTLFEVFVPSHQYWTAMATTNSVLGAMAHAAREG